MFKETHQTVLSEYEKFWERSNTGRCTLHLSYSKPGLPPYRQPKDLEEKWLDAEYNYDAYKYRSQKIGYLAEGIPAFFTNLGPGCLAACIGGSYGLMEKTIWFDQEQLIEEWEAPPAIAFDEQSEMWQNVLKMQNRFSADPDVCFSITDIGGIMDIVASLRGTENLLYDLYDYPDEVKEFAIRVKEEWFKAFDKQVEIIKKANLPFTNWFNIPSEKPWYPLQCDFAYMISPAQFEEFMLQDLVDQVGHMDRSIYHLDGAGEIPHVDMLLDIPGLTGIQWVPGAGQPSVREECWLDLYKKIQDKKKNLVLIGGVNEKDEAGTERLIKSLDPTGLYLSGHFSSREKAEEMLEKITRWSE